jgi:hypothetical protein
MWGMRYKIGDKGCEIQDAKCAIWDAGYEIADARYRIWDVG